MNYVVHAAPHIALRNSVNFIDDPINNGPKCYTPKLYIQINASPLIKIQNAHFGVLYQCVTKIIPKKLYHA